MSAVLTAAEAARMLRLSLPTLYARCHSGKLPVVVDRPLRLSRVAVERIVAAEGWEPATPRPATPVQQRQPSAGTGHVAALKRAPR